MTGEKTFSEELRKEVSDLIILAKKGELDAQLTLASLYDSERGTLDIGLAAMWCLEAAQNGSAEG